MRYACVIGFWLTVGCAAGNAQSLTSGSDPAPTVLCGTADPRAHPIRQFPSSPGQTDAERIAEGEAGFPAFCDSVRRSFAHPALDPDEAEWLYARLERTLHIVDESYGMPSPDEPLFPPVSVRERVAVRKIGDGAYEVYFWRTGCGMNYSLLRATRTAGDSVALSAVELWRESAPC